MTVALVISLFIVQPIAFAAVNHATVACFGNLHPRCFELREAANGAFISIASMNRGSARNINDLSERESSLIRNRLFVNDGKGADTPKGKCENLLSLETYKSDELELHVSKCLSTKHFDESESLLRNLSRSGKRPDKSK